MKSYIVGIAVFVAIAIAQEIIQFPVGKGLEVAWNFQKNTRVASSGYDVSAPDYGYDVSAPNYGHAQSYDSTYYPSYSSTYAPTYDSTYYPNR
jgi:hypothetical protein